MILYLIISFFVICLIGVLFHFVYDWGKHKKCLAHIFPVNESVWEHLKLGIVPTYLWGIIGIFVFHDNPNYPFAWFILLLSIMIIIPLIFYFYKAITKKSILAIDISLFCISIAVGLVFAGVILNEKTLPNWVNILSIIGTIIIFILFTLFTYLPPKIFLFKDPITNKYGRAGHLDDKDFGNNYTYKDKK